MLSWVKCGNCDLSDIFIKYRYLVVKKILNTGGYKVVGYESFY